VKFANVVDATTASALDVAWLNAQLEPLSEPGRRAYEQFEPLRPGQEREAAERAASIGELAQRIDPGEVDAMRDALRTMPDPLPALSRAAMGDVLEDANLLELLRFLEVAQRLRSYVPIATEVQRIAQLLEHGRAGKFGFYLSEKFDASLAPLRDEARRAQAEFDSARGRLAQRVAQELGREEISGAEFIVMRDTVARLPKDVRVVREAPTYLLCELDLDEAALEALRRRDAASERVAAAEEAVRARVSREVRQCARALDALVEAAGEFDMRLAQVRFAQQHDCVPARIVSERRVRFADARYLPLQYELETQGRRYEPISLELSDAAVLTGPNMGGKSVALRTCGFIALLAAFGIPVPAKSAECSIFDEIAWLGIGAQEELGGLLSSFAREVVRLNELLARPATNALLLIDEFARTTTPHEGKALLVALIRALRRRGRLPFIATHLAGIAADAGTRHFAVRGLRDVPKAAPAGDLQAALASLADSMDYAVVEVGDGGAAQADAVALAHLLGLDDDIVGEAADVLKGEAGSSWIR
jgi:DNA mismatch repair protein MutS2